MFFVIWVSFCLLYHHGLATASNNEPCSHSLTSHHGWDVEENWEEKGKNSWAGIKTV